MGAAVSFRYRVTESSSVVGRQPASPSSLVLMVKLVVLESITMVLTSLPTVQPASLYSVKVAPASGLPALSCLLTVTES